MAEMLSEDLQIEGKILADFGPFWLVLALLSQMYALFGVLFTGLNNGSVYQNRQIRGMQSCASLKSNRRILDSSFLCH